MNDTMTTVWRSPRSQWLKVSAAWVRPLDPIRADLWADLAADMERQEAQHYVRSQARGAAGVGASTVRTVGPTRS